MLVAVQVVFAVIFDATVITGLVPRAKAVVLVTVALPDFTAIGVPALAGTTTVNEVVDAPVTVAATPPKVTVLLAGVALNAVPVITTVEPTGADAGEKLVILRTGAGVSSFLQDETTANKPRTRASNGNQV